MRILLIIVFAASAFAQLSHLDVIPLPSNKLEAGIDIKVTPPLLPNAVLNPPPLLDGSSNHLSPPPTIKASVKEGLLHLDISGMHFWGKAVLRLDVTPGNSTTFTFQRGPSITTSGLTAEPGKPTQVWIYNHETNPLTLRWRLNGGIDSVCGLNPVDSPKESCSSPADWGTLTIPRATSKPLKLSLPFSWFAAHSVIWSPKSIPTQLKCCLATMKTRPV